MRVFSILPYPVLPLSHGGRVRAYQLSVALARAGATVDVACPWHPRLPPRPFEREGITVRPFVFAANALPALLGDRIVPPLVQLSLQPLTSGPRRLLRRCRLYDVVDFHFCAYASWMRRVATETRVVYSAHNVELDYERAQARLLGRAFERRIAQLERRAARASDLVIVCTEADGERLRKLYGELRAVTTIPNGFDASALGVTERHTRKVARAELGLGPEEFAILFVGGRGGHNRRAVRYLEDELLPRIARPARLVLAGECSRPRREGRVLAVGFAPELSPLLAAADVAVNPAEAGSGSNLKVAEYLAAGLPVVTTRVGLRGYEAFAEFVTVAGLDAFADAVAADHPRAGPPPGLAELSWSALGRRLYDTYVDLVARVPRPRPT
jgi:glycosyltransferase involved in cell wall biosynthesis